MRRLVIVSVHATNDSDFCEDLTRWLPGVSQNCNVTSEKDLLASPMGLLGKDSVIGTQCFPHLSRLGDEKNINKTDLMLWSSGKTSRTDLMSSER